MTSAPPRGGNKGVGVLRMVGLAMDWVAGVQQVSGGHPYGDMGRNLVVQGAHPLW